VIHELAIIDPTARLHESVEVGPWTIIGPDVEIGEGTKVESSVVIKGPTRIGARNHIYQFSTIGEATPDLKYRDEPTELHIGDDNVIRENVTIHRGTVQDRSLTEVGLTVLLVTTPFWSTTPRSQVM
jgi:UDP-N-acetylglucosamine acyltransferase